MNLYKVTLFFKNKRGKRVNLVLDIIARDSNYAKSKAKQTVPKSYLEYLLFTECKFLRVWI